MKRLLLIWALFLCSLTAAFAQFSGSGSGTKDDPYLVFNADQLSNMRNFLTQKNVYFKLMNDINLKEWIEENNPNQGWMPIGNSSSHFMGHFDGQNKEISGLQIDRKSTSYVGLFGYIENADIKNLKIICSIEGSDYTGGIAGYSIKSSIDNLSINGNILGASNVGSISGYSDQDVATNIFFEGNVTGDNSVGGVFGTTNGTKINDAITNLEIKGKEYVGGIVGLFNAKGTFGTYERTGNSYATCVPAVINQNKVHGTIEGTDCVGGLVGWIAGGGDRDINSSFFSGIIYGNDKVGGIAGGCQIDHWYELDYHSNITNSVSCANIKARDNIGGIIGYDNSGEPYREEINTSLSNNYFIGNIKGRNNIGGIAGYLALGNCSYNYSSTSISGNMNVGGLIGLLTRNDWGSYSTTIMSNIVASNIVAITSNAGCIFGKCDDDNLLGHIGQTGTSQENKGASNSVITINGIRQQVTDNLQNGTNTSLKSLKSSSTYLGLGWDFKANNWTILETESFPYKTWQTAPPVIESDLVSGATTISGKSVEGGTVTVEVGGKKYSANTTNNLWTVNADPLQAGDEVIVYSKVEGKEQSYWVMDLVGYKGKGTIDDPYQIYTAEDLQGVIANGNYKLMNDIDVSSWISSNSPIRGWQPIGKGKGLQASLDGDGHKVTGLWINTSDDYTGLFSNFSNGTIANLNIQIAEGKSIKGGNFTGGIVGKLINGKIINCHINGDIESDSTFVGGIAGYTESCEISRASFIGSVTSSGEGIRAGGLVGYSSSDKINKSYTEATITATGNNSSAGGLIGFSNSIVNECSSKGNVSAVSTSSIAGGLIGQSQNNGEVSDCYSTATAEGDTYAAGLVGYNYGKINKCYAKGNVSSQQTVAGIVGYNDGSNATTSNTVAANHIVSSSSANGIAIRSIGGIRNGAPAPTDNNYAYKDMQVSVNGVPKKVSDDILNGFAKSEAEILAQSTYSELGWDFVSVWGIYEGSAMPYLLYNAPTQRPQTVTMPTIGTMTYGDEAIVLPKTTDQGMIITWSSDNDKVAAINDNVLSIVGAGKASVKGTQAGSDEWLPFETQTIQLTVNKAKLNVTADNKSKEKGQPNPTFTISYDGFVNGDDSLDLDELPKVICAANETSDEGKYDIVLYGGKDDNYDYVFHNGVLTIIPSTGIVGIISEKAPVDVYTASGVKVRSHATTLEGLKSGVYIVNRKKVIKK